MSFQVSSRSRDPLACRLKYVIKLIYVKTWTFLGRRIEVRLSQRGRSFELTVRATKTNGEGSSKMTTNDFEDCDNENGEGKEV